MATVVGIVIGIILYVLCVIGMWRMFRKAGRMGWPSIIPVVNTAFLCMIGWKKIWPFILEIVTGVVGWLLVVFGYVLAVIVLISESGSAGASVAMMIIGVILMIVALVISIIMLHRVSKAFGHGAGYTVGLIFVPFIMFPIIGLGSSEYIDEKEPAPAPEPEPEPEPAPEATEQDEDL